MKQLVLVVIALLSSSMAYAVTQAQAAHASNSHKTCIKQYLTCRDNCDYYQDASQINPCRMSCDQKYKCRPKKVHHNIGDNAGEF